MRARSLLAITIALACSGGAPATAVSSPARSAARPRPPRFGAPFTVAANVKNPWVAVDDNGTAHIVWSETVGGSDVTHYCQVPRGRRACARQQTFRPRGAGPTDFPGPKVVVSDQGDVIILASRCCAINTTTYAYASADGGATFVDEGVRSATPGGGGPTGDTEFGPGAFSVTMTSDTETAGLFSQTVPWESGPPVSSHARLNSDVDQTGPLNAIYDGTVAMVDPTTPIVAFTDRSHIYYRRWSGTGNINSASSWLPSQTFGPGAFTRLTSGPKGVFLLYSTSGTGGNYRIARYASQSNRFVAQATLDTNVDPWRNRQDLWEDASGNLHAAWRNANGGTYQLKAAIARDGRTWSRPVAVATASLQTGMDDVHMRTARDGGGFAIWSNASGTLMAVPFSPLGGGGGETCPTEIRFGVTQALAKDGCFAKHGSTYTIASAIRINGLDVEPAGGAMPKLTIDRARGTLTSAGPVVVSAGAVKLARKPLDWVIPNAGGELHDSAGNPVTLEVGSFHQKVLGLPLSGYVTPKFRRHAADLPINLLLPQPVESALGGQDSSNVTLHTDQLLGGGLVIDKGHFHLHVDDANFGIAELRPIDINYTADPAELSGHVALYLPVVANAKLDSTFLFREGDFVDATGTFQFPEPGLPVGTMVYLNSINFHAHAFTSCHDPTSIGGGVTFTGGPQLFGVRLVRIDGDVTYAFPKAVCNLPGVLTVSGKGYLLDFQVADVEATFKTSGYLGFGAHVDIGSPKTIQVYAGIDGYVDFPSKNFYAGGDASVTALGYSLAHATMAVSSVGLGGCVTLVPLILAGNGIDAGFEYKWGQHLSLMMPDCDISDLKPAATAMRLTPAGVRVQSAFTVPAGLPSYGVSAFGPNGPTVTVTDPQGHKFTAPRPGRMTDSGPGYSAFRMPGLNETAVSLKSPVPGVWHIDAPPSAGMTKVLTGDGRPQPSVTARVRRLGGRSERLVYRVKPIPGQVVRFAERGADTSRVIGRATRASGSLKFQAGDGRAGQREIVALIQQDGFPRAQPVVTHYAAPGPIKPSRPRVRVRRAGARLVVRWSKARYAVKYVVRAELRDGRRSEWLIRATRRSFRIPRVPGVDSGRILVAGIARNGMVGRPGVARVARHPKKRRHRRQH